MFFIRILVLISLQTLIECKGSSLFCTHNHWNDYSVNRFQSIFTIDDKVYIRAGIEVSNIWVYDINTQQVLKDPISGPTMFPGFPIVEFVSAVLCDNCRPDVSNVVIVIGRQDLQSYHKFGVFRLQSDGSFAKIDRLEDLPKGWLLRDGEEEFTLNAPFYGFFPEKMVTLTTNSSYIHGFAFFPWLQIFNLKYYTELGRFFAYRKIRPDGSLTDWKETGIIGRAHVLNSAFYIKEKIYAIDNDPQYFPRISHEIIVENTTGILVFRVTDVDIDAREFFNCYDNITDPSISVIVSPKTTSKTTTTLTTPPTTITTTPSTTTTTTARTTESTTTSTTTPPTKPSTETTTIFSTTKMSTYSTTSETAITTTISTTSSVNITDSTYFELRVNDDKDDYVLFWIIFFILLLIILLIIFGLICLIAYYRKGKKGEQYDSLDAGGSSASVLNKNGKPGIVLSGSPSNMSMRSNRDNTNIGMNRADSQSPSTISMRSQHNPKKPIVIPMSTTSPSTASVRSFKN